MPRSLNEPVGFAPSIFSSTRAPTCSERRGASTSGVLPSLSVTTGVRSVTGRRSRYASMRPGQPGVRELGHSSPPTTRSTEPTRLTAVEVAHLADRRRHRRLAREVRDEDQAGVVALALLLHRLDRHLVLAEHAGDRREHTGLVGRVERHVELRRRLVDRADRPPLERADRRAPRARVQVLGRVDEVAEQRARRRAAAGAPAEQHQLADRLALDEHRVERAAHRRERMTDRHHRRVHAHADRAVDLLGDREQLHDVAELGRRRRCRRR